MEGRVDRFAWNYYSFNLESENAIVVRVTERRQSPSTAASDCDLYVKRGEFLFSIVISLTEKEKKRPKTDSALV